MIEQSLLVQAQLEPGEKVVWMAQPDRSRQLWRSLSRSVILLSAVYCESVSLLWAHWSQELFLVRLIAMSGLALLCSCLVVMAPRCAERISYVLTDRRVMKLDCNKRVHSSVRTRFKGLRKVLISEYECTAQHFWLGAFACILILATWMIVIVPKLLLSFDIFMALSFILLAVVAAGYLTDSNFVPSARWRDLSSVLYSINDRLVCVQFLRHSEVSDLRVRRNRASTFDLFLVSDDHGCLRLLDIDSEEGVEYIKACIPERNCGQLESVMDLFS